MIWFGGSLLGGKLICMAVWILLLLGAGFVLGFWSADIAMRYYIRKATGLDTNEFDSLTDFLRHYKDL